MTATMKRNFYGVDGAAAAVRRLPAEDNASQDPVKRAAQIARQMAKMAPSSLHAATLEHLNAAAEKKVKGTTNRAKGGRRAPGRAAAASGSRAMDEAASDIQRALQPPVTAEFLANVAARLKKATAARRQADVSPTVRSAAEAAAGGAALHYAAAPVAEVELVRQDTARGVASRETVPVGPRQERQTQHLDNQDGSAQQLDDRDQAMGEEDISSSPELNSAPSHVPATLLHDQPPQQQHRIDQRPARSIQHVSSSATIVSEKVLDARDNEVTISVSGELFPEVAGAVTRHRSKTAPAAWYPTAEERAAVGNHFRLAPQAVKSVRFFSKVKVTFTEPTPGNESVDRVRTVSFDITREGNFSAGGSKDVACLENLEKPTTEQGSCVSTLMCEVLTTICLPEGYTPTDGGAAEKCRTWFRVGFFVDKSELLEAAGTGATTAEVNGAAGAGFDVDLLGADEIVEIGARVLKGRCEWYPASLVVDKCEVEFLRSADSRLREGTRTRPADGANILYARHTLGAEQMIAIEQLAETAAIDPVTEGSQPRKKRRLVRAIDMPGKN